MSRSARVLVVEDDVDIAGVLRRSLDKEGYVDFQAALNDHFGKGVTPNTNANVLIWKALGPTPPAGKTRARSWTGRASRTPAPSRPRRTRRNARR